MTYCVSDIHGEYELFRRLLDSIKFSDADTLISCGDIIDKGNGSVRLLKFIKNMPNARCINGNHEYDFLKLYWGLMRQSPDNFGAVLKELRGCFPSDGGLLDWDIVDWLENLPYYIEEPDYICVHAGVPLNEDGSIVSPAKATREQLVYDRRFKDPGVVVNGGKCVIFGHTPTAYILNDGTSRIIAYRRKQAPKNSYKITDFYKVHIDTGAWIDGVLGCFCIDTCSTYYVKK